MNTPAELQTKIRAFTDWDDLRTLWSEVQTGAPNDWGDGKALEYLIVRAFELDPDEPAVVRYPYRVPLFGETVEEIDGAVHLPGLSCLIESKDWSRDVAIGPIVKLRSQLLRRPAGTIGLLFSKQAYTEPARILTHFTMPQAVLLWSEFDLHLVMETGRISRYLRLKHRIACEYGLPDYDLRGVEIP